MTRFLTIDEALLVHADQIRRYGGSTGVRDRGLLESALAMPQAVFGGQYLHNSIYDMAAAYLFHIVSNHPFVDGNKRVGAVAALVFLDLNGYRLDGDVNEQLEAIVLSAASGKSDKAAIALFFRQHCKPASV